MIYLQMKTIKLNLKGILGIITLCTASLLVGVAYADEPIKITISSSMCCGGVQFDGAWTHDTEWKASSFDKYWYDRGTANAEAIILRTAHQDKFFYILINYLSDFRQYIRICQEYRKWVCQDTVLCIDHLFYLSYLPLLP